ncbi:hypothetical protein BDR26DRAFT_853649 [Obelidium mucronatum]|nr:hypothetical protein BDR26DRAFT_853649 [Obelidium mucronatum]
MLHDTLSANNAADSPESTNQTEHHEKQTREEAAKAMAELRWAWLVGPHAQHAAESVRATNAHAVALETMKETHIEYIQPSSHSAEDPHHLDLDLTSLAIQCRLNEIELSKKERIITELEQKVLRFQDLEDKMLEMQKENTDLVSRLAAVNHSTSTQSPAQQRQQQKPSPILENSSTQTTSAPSSPSQSVDPLASTIERNVAQVGNSSPLQLSLLQTQLTSLTEALSSSNRQSNTQKQKIESLEGLLKESNSKLSLSESRIADLTTRILDLETELNSTVTRTEESESTLDMKKPSPSLEEKLCATEKEADDLKLQIQESRSDTQISLNASKEVSDTMKSTFTAQVLERDSRIQVLEKCLESSELENERLALQVNELTACCAEYESKRVVQQDEIENLESRLNQVERECVAYKARMESLEVAREEVEASAAETHTSLMQSQLRVTELEKCLQESRQALDIVEEDLMSRIEAKVQELRELQHAKLAIEEELGLVRDELIEYKAVSADSRHREQELNQLRDRIESLQLDFNQQQSQHETIIREYQVEISVLQTKYSHLQQQQQQQEHYQQQQQQHKERQSSVGGKANTSFDMETGNFSISSETTTETLHLLDNAIGLMQPDGSISRSVLKTSPPNPTRNGFLTNQSSTATLIPFSPTTTPQQQLQHNQTYPASTTSPPPPTASAASATNNCPKCTATTKEYTDKVETLTNQHFEKEMEWLAQLVSTQQQSITTITSLRTQLETSAMEVARLKGHAKEIGSELLWKEKMLEESLEKLERGKKDMRQGLERALKVYESGDEDGGGNFLVRLETAVEEERLRWAKAEADLLKELDLLSV